MHNRIRYNSVCFVHHTLIGGRLWLMYSSTSIWEQNPLFIAKIRLKQKNLMREKKKQIKNEYAWCVVHGWLCW